MGAFLTKHWYKMLMALISIVLIGVIVYRNMDHTPKMKEIGEAPDFSMNTMDGQPYTFKASSGKVRLVYFFYTNCPDVCLPTSYMLSKAQDDLKAKGIFGNKAEIVSVTFDPKRDTPEVLKQFAVNFNADSKGWTFLRGDEEETKALASKFGIAILKDKEGNFAHANFIELVDAKGKIRKSYNASSIDYQEIVKDVEQLTKE